MSREAKQFNWNALLPHLIHPLKVAIIEALLWVEEPISAPDLRKLFGERFSAANISYHLARLTEHGALEMTGKRQGRGMPEKFYFFPPGR